MSNLYFKLDIETEVFASEDIKNPIKSIHYVILRYSGFTDVQHEYDIILQENDFIDHCELEINTTEPYIVKIRGLAKIKPKEDLFLNILEDKKPYIYLLKIHTEPFEILETKTSNKSKKMICDVSSKKP